VVRASATARLCVVGQAPGTRVHASGIPFSDPSGERLRAWMGVEPEVFYDEARIAIVPMSFCFPGLDAHGSDKPPRRECAPAWHDRLFTLLPNVELTLLVGGYAQVAYLGRVRGKTMTETVRAWRSHMPRFLPMPHPSWRNTAWLRRNPWFEAELVPVLRREVRRLTAPGG
jgi:uracil-DNA glycosylase